MKENYLLKSKEAESLYRAVKDLPIIDYHNHISVADIKSDRRFDNLYEIWLECDPYKHRLMRICGVPEEFITGDRAPYEKFERFVKLLPMLAGNPVYDWAKMELSTVFGIDDPTSLQGEGLRYIQEHTMTPARYTNELKGMEKFVFEKLYAGGFSKKLYRMFEYGKGEKND